MFLVKQDHPNFVGKNVRHQQHAFLAQAFPAKYGGHVSSAQLRSRRAKTRAVLVDVSAVILPRAQTTIVAVSRDPVKNEGTVSVQIVSVINW